MTCICKPKRLVKRDLLFYNGRSDLFFLLFFDETGGARLYWIYI